MSGRVAGRPSKIRLAEINACSSAEFVQQLGHVFEDSAWVADRAWRLRPFTSVQQLHAAMWAQVKEAPAAEKLSLLRAHPDLGARAPMSDASVSEQSGAGLDRLTPEEYDTLQSLNHLYREKFGFPFLFAVKGSTKYDIIDALRRRMDSTAEQEFQEALAQVNHIAGFRLEEMIMDEGGD